MDRQELPKIFVIGALAVSLALVSARFAVMSRTVSGLKQFIDQTRSNDKQFMEWRVEDRNRLNKLEKDKVVPFLPEPKEYKEMKRNAKKSR